MRRASQTAAVIEQRGSIFLRLQALLPGRECRLRLAGRFHQGAKIDGGRIEARFEREDSPVGVDGAGLVPRSRQLDTEVEPDRIQRGRSHAVPADPGSVARDDPTAVAGQGVPLEVTQHIQK